MIHIGLNMGEHHCPFFIFSYWKFFCHCTASYEPFIYIERDPRSRTEIGERDTQLVHVNEATAV